MVRPPPSVGRDTEFHQDHLNNKGAKLSDIITSFFERLGGRGHEPLLERQRGTIRFDVLGDRRVDHWFVVLDRGEISVSHSDADADCVIRTDRSALEGIVSGNVNTVAAFLRGQVALEGDLELLVFFRRMFPGPPDARGPARPTAEGVAS
jgi:hypothetical protein